MSFRVNPNPTFIATAVVNVPSDQGVEKRELKVLFNLCGEEEQPENSDGGKDFLRGAVVELFDLVDEAGRQIPYDTDVLEALLRWPFIRTALLTAYYRTLNGAILGN